jgi:NAD(P)-dependent dehydrogenase (short-subunit alcohol dehydrogenase family)
MFNVMAVVSLMQTFLRPPLSSQDPYLATKHFIPQLKKGAEPKVADISSEFGCIGCKSSSIFSKSSTSIEEGQEISFQGYAGFADCVWQKANERGGFLGYRMAKAALNQQTKTIAQAFKNDSDEATPLTLITLEPGYVATRLTGWKGDTDIDTSVRGMVAVIEGAKHSDSGLFFEYTGKRLDF